MIFFGKDKCIDNFRKKTHLFFSILKTIIFSFLFIILISILLLQVSCGLFYTENSKQIKGSNVTGSSASSLNSSQTSESESNSKENNSLPESIVTDSGASPAENISNNSNIYENKNFNDSDYSVINVFDGDTVELKNSMVIRFIGINTPEKDMYFYEEAKEFMEILVLGKQVKLEKDVTNKDMYGRYLRYVYLPDLFVNFEMVWCGFANAYTYPPDVKYTDKFLEAERSARKNEAGLWQKSSTEVLEVVLNYDAEGKDTENLNGEWASIKNTGSKSLNMDGWTLKDAGTNIYRFEDFTLESGKNVILYTGSGTNTREKLYWNSKQPIWNNEHDTLYLRDNNGLLVYIYNY